jgi:general secretion pathway protein K
VKIHPQSSTRGIALIIVMLVITVLTVLVAGLAYSMKVEMTLARNVGSEADMELIGRSGVEFARYILAQQLNCPNEQFDSLNQTWAGGPGGNCSSNGPLVNVSLKDNQLGPGKFSLQIVDLERKVNINYANLEILDRTLQLMGLDPTDRSGIVDSIEDWRDRDPNPHLNGAESDYYLTLPQPYIAKDGPVDDLSELLLVRGITREIYWGPGRKDGGSPSVMAGPVSYAATYDAGADFAFGLADLFNTIGRMQVNVNTASEGVLQLLPGMDGNLARGVVKLRAGLDEIDGTEDDTPLHNVGELINVPGMAPQFVQQLQSFCGVRSFTFEVRVDVQIEQYRRRLIALLFRNGPRDVQVLNTYWE